ARRLWRAALRRGLGRGEAKGPRLQPPGHSSHGIVFGPLGDPGCGAVGSPVLARYPENQRLALPGAWQSLVGSRQDWRTGPASAADHLQRVVAQACRPQPTESDEQQVGARQ
ncbi:unnamed protein product, partial [Polarella glacialis]